MQTGSQRRDHFEQVARELVEPLRRYLRRRTDPETADDVLSETLLVCWRRLEEMPAEPLPWAYGVARHCLANAERSAQRQRRLAGRLAILRPPSPPGPQADTGGDRALAEALAGLRAEDAELLRLWAWEQLTPAELATMLGASPNAVSIRLHRAKRKLAAQLRKNDRPAGHEGSEPGRRR